MFHSLKHFCKDVSFSEGILQGLWNQVAQLVKNLPVMQETEVHLLGWENLEKEMTTQSSILAWEIPWTKKLGGLKSMRLQESHDWVIKLNHHKLPWNQHQWANTWSLYSQILCLFSFHIHSFFLYLSFLITTTRKTSTINNTVTVSVNTNRPRKSSKSVYHLHQWILIVSLFLHN